METNLTVNGALRGAVKINRKIIKLHYVTIIIYI